MLLEERRSGRTWLLQTERVYRLGRNPDQDIRLDDPSVSRTHAELFWEGQDWHVRDCGSRFGVYLGNRRIQKEEPVTPQTWFRLGAEPGIMLRLTSPTETGPTADASAELIDDAAVYYPPAPAAPPFTLAHFQGRPTVKQALKEYADLILDANLNHPVQGILMLGGEGSGKRFLCRCLADQLSQERRQSISFMSRDLKEAKNLYHARKLIRQWLKECTQHAPTVLLLQNFDTFYHYLKTAEQTPQIETGQTTWWKQFWGSIGIVDLESEVEKARRLRKLLDADIETYWQWNLAKDTKILIIASAKHPDALPPEMRKPGGGFSYVLPIPRPDEAGRLAILEKYLHDLGAPINRELDLLDLVRRLGRTEGHSIERLVKDAERHRYQTGTSYLSWRDFEPFLPISSDQLWGRIFLPDPILQRLKQLAKILREYDLSTSEAAVPPKGLLLTGPPGTGKTEIARLLAQDANCYFQAIAPSTIKSSLVGQAVKNLQAIFAYARTQAPAILFFDEIDALFPRRDEQSGDPTALEIVNQFLQEVDGFEPSTGVFVLGATNRAEEIDPAVRSRLQEQISLALPEQAERVQMLRYFTTQSTNQALALAADIDLAYYAQLLMGKSGRGIQAIATRVITAAQEAREAQSTPTQLEQSPSGDALTLERQHFEQVLTPKPAGQLTGVVLPDRIRAELMQSIQQFLKAFADPRITPPAGLLLSGPPGTGKTEVARAIARLGGIHFQAVTASDVQTSFVGESERKLAKIFEQARHNAPTVLFFDEIDGLFPSRGEGGSQHEIRLVNQFLQEVDGAKTTGRGIFILGASNRAERVDAAVRSRLNKIIEIPLPELSQRIELLQLFVSNRPVDSVLDWRAIAMLLAGKSGRAIRARVEEAYHLACEENATGEIDLSHFRRAIVGDGERADAPDLVLSEPLMQQVEQRLDTLRNLPQALTLGLPAPKGLLLTGPPGVGKTQIARYLAAKAGLFFRDVKPSDVRSLYHGGSLKNLQTIFADARDRAPCILFFDEIDSLFPRRGEAASNLEIELVNEFLQQVDGMGQSSAGIFILGATNRADAVDPAAASRLQQTMTIPLPGPRERRILLEHALQQKHWSLAEDVDLAAIGNFLQGKSGRDIQAIMTRIGEAYIQRVGWQSTQVVLTHADFERALSPPVEVDPTAWGELILAPGIKAELQTTVQRFLRFFRNPIPGVTPPKGMLLSGPPGTGKTQAARVLSKVAGCQFMAVPVAEMRSKFVGEALKKLSQTFEQARRDAPVILFIDEMEALFPKQEGVSPQHEVELINQLLQELDGVGGGAPGVFVVGATNFAERVDDAVRSRLNKLIEITLPGQAEIAQMLQLFTQAMPVEQTLDWEAIARLLLGKSGRDIRQLVSEVGQYAADHLDPDTPLAVTTDHFRSVLQAKAPVGDLTWNDVILPPEPQQELQRLVKLAANYTHLPPGITPPKGAILTGPPGVGKTQVARVIASVAGLYFKNCTPGDIRSKYVGQGAQNLANAFNQARQHSPAILFFDEIESLFPRREDMGGSSVDLENQNLVNQFLQEVDGVRRQGSYVFVLGATNHPELLDAAVRSRLQREIFIPLPGFPERLQLLKAKLHDEWALAADVDLTAYAEALTDCTGRDINTGVETAAQLAFDDWVEGRLVICDRHFRKAFNL